MPSEIHFALTFHAMWHKMHDQQCRYDQPASSEAGCLQGNLNKVSEIKTKYF